jgi:hypothetical protein
MIRILYLFILINYSCSTNKTVSSKHEDVLKYKSNTIKKHYKFINKKTTNIC